MIPITKPFLGKEEAVAAQEAVLSGWVTQGPRVKAFEESFAKYVGAKYACAVSSCTTALHLGLTATGVKPGNVVVTVSHSFIATANAIRYCLAEPVFVDIEPDSFNMSPEALNHFLEDHCHYRDGKLYYRKVNEIARDQSPLALLNTSNKEFGRVGAVLAVHQIGMPCDLKAILEISEKYQLPAIEDAACAIGSEIKLNCSWEKIGKPHADIACFSFHPRKVITTGDGGMLVTNNQSYHKQFQLLRQHGMSIPDTVRHAAKKVVFEQYVLTGYNYRMTDIQAAIGLEQLKKLPLIFEKRRALNEFYRQYLRDIDWLKPPKEPSYAKSNWQSYGVRVLSNAPLSRDALMQYLLDNGVTAKPGIMNAHQEKPYSNSNFHLPESERARNDVILLPFYPQLEERDIRTITDLMKKAR